MSKECVCGNPEGTNAECDRCRLISQRDALADVLRELVDLQNGPPLIKREAEWAAAMDNAHDELRRAGK